MGTGGLVYTSTLMMDAVCSFETSVNLSITTRSYMAEDSTRLRLRLRLRLATSLCRSREHVHRR
jgi:hypothetical protein